MGAINEPPTGACANVEPRCVQPYEGEADLARRYPLWMVTDHYYKYKVNIFLKFQYGF